LIPNRKKARDENSNNRMLINIIFSNINKEKVFKGVLLTPEIF
jgi:hypothetical protein